MAGESVDMAPAEEILKARGIKVHHSGTVEEFLIPFLQDVQSAYGYLPKEVLMYIGKHTDIPLSRMYGVITFYTQFHLEPRGKHIIRCCQGTACHVKGSKRIAEAISEHLNVAEGGTTSDGRFTFEVVQCLGTCFLAPVIMVDENYHGELTAESVKKVLDSYE